MGSNRIGEHNSDRFCIKGKIERFVEPCLLLLLAEKPAHGYELMENLDQFDFDPRCKDPGQIYRTLRRMESEGMVISVWETGESGPARRSYEITPDGRDVLAAWMQTLEKRMIMVRKLLTRYGHLTPKESE
jgi:PadR family transcriptional regulator, regulatory protein PadR